MKPLLRFNDPKAVGRDRRLRFAAGCAVGGLVALLIATLLGELLFDAPEAAAPVTINVIHLVRMTAIQAGLSTFLALSTGIALAWALDRLRFAGRRLVAGLMASAIVIPGLVIAMGLLTVWGRNGWVNNLLDPAGLSSGASIYGLIGILAAHTILDGAFVGTILLARLASVPAARLKTGRGLRLTSLQRFQLIDWPLISASVPGLGAIVFLLAFTSFPIVLLLGGGPANQTLEVAIYGLIRLDFDLRAAANLAIVQIVICGLVILPVALSTPAIVLGGAPSPWHWPERGSARLLAILIVCIGLLGIGSPLAAVLFDGMGSLPALFTASLFWTALATSLLLGTASAVCATGLAIIVILARIGAPQPFVRSLLSVPAFIYLTVPGVVLSLGFLLLVGRLGIAPAAAGPVVLLVANALLALPFALTILGPAVDALTQRYSRQMQNLRLGGLQRWRLIEWPLLGPEIGLVFALAFCFSLGDLSVISLFGTEGFSTLPLAMYRAAGAYRNNEASAIAAIMVILAFLAFFLLPALFRRWSNAPAD